MRRNHQYERDLVRRPCVRRMRFYQQSNAFGAYDFVYWSCPPDHGNVSPKIAKQLQLDGYSKGLFDMHILGVGRARADNYLIEFKHGKNGFTKEQKAVADAVESTPVKALIIRDVNAFDQFLKQHLMGGRGAA